MEHLTRHFLGIIFFPDIITDIGELFHAALLVRKMTLVLVVICAKHGKRIDDRIADALFDAADFLEQSLLWAAGVVKGDITVFAAASLTDGTVICCQGRWAGNAEASNKRMASVPNTCFM